MKNGRKLVFFLEDLPDNRSLRCSENSPGNLILKSLSLECATKMDCCVEKTLKCPVRLPNDALSSTCIVLFPRSTLQTSTLNFDRISARTRPLIALVAPELSFTFCRGAVQHLKLLYVCFQIT